MKRQLFILLLLARSAWGLPIHNRTTGVDYATMLSCFAALSNDGSNVLIEVDGPLSTTAICTLSKNVNSLIIIGINGQQTLDCNGLDSFFSFNGIGKTLQNITIENFRIINNNPVTSAAAAIRYTTVGGKNYLRRITFNNCSIPVRGTTACGKFTIEDCVALNYTMGVFRFGLGSQTGVNPNVQDVDSLVFRRCNFDGTMNANTEAELVVKRMPSLLVEDCTFNNSAKYAISVYDPAANCLGQFRRCQFINGHSKATSGGTIDLAPNVTTGAGTTGRLLVESCIFYGDKGPAIQQTKGIQASIYNNLFVEGTGNTSNTVSFSNGRNFLDHYGNIYVANSTNSNAFVNIGTMAYDSDQLHSDYNLYYKTTNRGLFQGTTTGGTDPRTVNSSTLALLQAKGYDVHGLNTQPVFNTTDKKKSTYYLSPTSPGRNGGNSNYPPSQSPAGGALAGTVFDLGALDLKSYRYRTGRYRIVKSQ